MAGARFAMHYPKIKASRGKKGTSLLRKINFKTKPQWILLYLTATILIEIFSLLMNFYKQRQGYLPHRR